MYHKMLFFQIQKGKNFVKIQCGTKLDRLFFNSRKEPDMTRLYAFLKKSPLENNRKILIAALCLLVIAGMVPRIYGLIRLPHEFFHNDGNEYRDISEQLYKGNGFSVTSYRWYEAVPPDRTSDLHTDFSRPPLLPLLGAGLYFLPFDWTVSAKVTTVLLSVICILMTFRLGKEIFSSSTVGFLAAAIYTFYPYSIYHSLCWSSENLFLIFLCASYLFLCRCIRRSFAWKYAALCGAMLALAVLTRPQGIMLFLLFGLCGGIYFLRRKEARMSVFKSAAAFGLAGLLVFLPWMIRNQRAAGIPSPLSFYGPYSFSQASSDVSYMTYRYVDTPEYKERTDLAWNTFHDEKVKLLGEKKIYSLVDANPYWKKWAWEYSRENPRKMAFIVWNRILHCIQDGSECGGSFKYNRNLLQNILRLLSCTFPLRNMVCKKKYMRHASAAVPCKCRGSCSSFSDDPALPLPVLRSVRVHFRGLRTLPAGSMFCRTEKKSIADIFGKQPDTVDQQKQGKPPQQFAAPDEKQGKSGNPAADRN